MISHAIRVAFLLVILASGTNATSIKSVTLEDLYQEADVVAYTKVVSADSQWVHGLQKLEILEAFKGATSPNWLYVNGDNFSRDFGLYSKQVVFLRLTAETIPWPAENKADVICPTPLQPGAPVYTVMYAGYSVLPVASTSLFMHSRDRDYGWDGVDVCTLQVILPDRLKPTFEADSTHACDRNWVRLGEFLRYLRHIPSLLKVGEDGESQ